MHRVLSNGQFVQLIVCGITKANIPRSESVQVYIQARFVNPAKYIGLD
jgi:hypothetical protein